MDNFRSQNQMWNNGFMDAINLLSFVVGLQNMELNLTAQDLSEQSDRILNEIHRHLATQDEHLDLQDKHLIEQDKRLDHLERYMMSNARTNPESRKEKK